MGDRCTFIYDPGAASLRCGPTERLPARGFIEEEPQRAEAESETARSAAREHGHLDLARLPRGWGSRVAEVAGPGALAWRGAAEQCVLQVEAA